MESGFCDIDWAMKPIILSEDELKTLALEDVLEFDFPPF